jgi:hypothetical protein
MTSAPLIASDCAGSDVNKGYDTIHQCARYVHDFAPLVLCSLALLTKRVQPGVQAQPHNYSSTKKPQTSILSVIRSSFVAGKSVR